MKNSLELGGRDDPDRNRGFSRSRIILVGARRDARKLLQQMRQDPARELMIVGFVDAGHQQASGPKLRGRHLAVHPHADPVPVVGGLDRLHELVDRTRATDVVVAVPHKPRRHPVTRLSHFTKSDVKVHWVPVDAERLDLAALPLRRQSTEQHGGSLSQPWRQATARMALAGDPGAGRQAVGRYRGFRSWLADAFSPLAVVSLAIYLTSGGPIFYSQERVGQGGRRFRIIKFRSMRTDAESETGPIWASYHDSRCTRIGDWLRHTNIDELPQLFNVLKGDMSLVGPRPERPMFVDQFRHAMPDYDLRHAVPAGMTGWAQVHGWRGRTSLRKRIQYDLDYIQRWSFWLDFLIMLMTIQHVAWGKISWNLSRPPKKSGKPSTS